MVAVVGETRAGDVDGGSNGDEDEDEGPDWGCGGLVADGYDVVFGEGGRGEARLGPVLALGGGNASFLEVRGRYRRGVCGICAEWSGRQEWDGHGKL